MAAPLTGLRVLDLSRVLAGPWAGQTLADLGAEVVKVERPGAGDDTRAWGPPYARDADGRDTSESAYFLSANRGKASITVDITTPEGQAIVRDLAGTSDVVIENFKVGTLVRYGLDYASLKKKNPHLVYCSISGFGQDGPLASLPGYDFMIQGMGGLMSITGKPDGEPGAGPVKVGVAVADLFTGLYATIGILAALRRRDQTGEGAHVDVSLLDCQLAMLANQAMNYLASGVSPSRLGNAHPNIVPYEVFATADGYIILAVGNDAQYQAFCRLANRSDLGTDPRFATNRARVAHRQALIPLVAETIKARASADWLAALGKVGIPAGPINSIGEAFASDHVAHRGMRLDLSHPTAGAVPSVASPIVYAGEPRHVPRAPPLLGADTEAVLATRLALPPDTIDSYRARGIV